MKTLSILAVGLILSGCLPNGAPKLPEVKYQYAVLFDGNTPFCVRSEILSVEPYRVGNRKAFPIKACEGMTGLQLRDFQKVVNWVEDTLEWARTKTNITTEEF